MAHVERPGAETADRDTETRKALLESGDRLGVYEIEARVGSGGMAEVYRGRHTSLDKRVAIKVLLPEIAANEDLRERFLREGRAASRIQHPHVVDVTDVGKEGELVYLVMELLEGETLGDRLAREVVLAPEEILDCLIPVIAATAAAHASGVVHRDLKPENIFLARDLGGRPRPKVLDFGVSKIDGTSLVRMTTKDSVLGTPHYMSPEQAKGLRDVDGRTDQYAIGVILYEALVGRLPYDATRAIDLLREVSSGPVRPPRAFTSSVPEALSDVLMRALSNAREDRYPTMEAFGLALLPFASDHTSGVFRAALEGTVAPAVAARSRSGDSERPTGTRKRAELRTAPHRKVASGPQPTEAPVVRPASAALDAAQVQDDAVASTPAASSLEASEPASTPAPVATIEPTRNPLRTAGLLGLALALGLVGWLLLRPPPPVLRTLSIEPAARVILDGVEVGQGVLVTITVADDDTPHRLRIEGPPGYTPYVAQAVVSALPSFVHLERTVAPEEPAP